MLVINTVAALRQCLAQASSVSFVPTMGNLHAGHIQLTQLAREHARVVVASIFVNPLQFGANEDLASYPRTLEADLQMLEAAGVDIAFVPGVEDMYPTQQSMMIALPSIADDLCGAARPGHFAGVATVVIKLFNIVRPQVAVFGKKDFQQLHIMRELVQQFNLPVVIVAGDTVRDADGLALSSRNSYLSPAQRLEATRLSKALKLAAEAIQKGARNYADIETQTTQFLTQLGWIVDYISVRSGETLLPPSPQDLHLVVLGAARQGKTRLIDNIEVNL